MARNARASRLETRTSRLKLPIAKKPVFVRIGPGTSLGYRRTRTNGTWVARIANGRGGNWTKGIGVADDFDEANGVSTLNFWQAQERTRTLSHHRDDLGKLLTVRQALDLYEANLRERGADAMNVIRIRAHLTEPLAKKTVALLTVRELAEWRTALSASKLTASSINRTASVFRAALNLAADRDERIINHQAWRKGLATIPDATEPRNVILKEPVVLRIIASAYETVGEEFGRLVETLAVTGTRISQAARLDMQDLQADRNDPRLMMPSSRKGRWTKKITRKPVPIPASLVTRLRRAIGKKTAPLLPKHDGSRWKRSDHLRLFQNVVKNIGLDPSEVTIYALRHSSIVRQLLAGVPIRVVAAAHDTSVAMIEKTYSRHITDHSDALSRGAMLDVDALSTADVVVPFSGKP